MIWTNLAQRAVALLTSAIIVGMTAALLRQGQFAPRPCAARRTDRPMVNQSCAGVSGD